GLEDRPMKKTSHFSWFAPVAVLLAVVISIDSANAQTLYGSMVGNVTDPSGAAVPGATVSATNPATGFVRETTTDERGAYLFTDLQPGTYEVRVSSPAFASFTKTGVPVTTNAVVRTDVPLQLSGVAETVTVSASAV